MSIDSGELLEQAREALGRGEDQETERLCAMILSISPSCIEAKAMLGVVAARARRDAEALEILRSVLDSEPSCLLALNWTSAILNRGGHAQEAAKYSLRAVELHPEDPDAHGNLGLCSLSLRDTPSAIRHFQRAIELAPHAPSLHHNLGLALQLEGNDDEAAKSFRSSIELDPSVLANYMRLAQILLNHSMLDEAAECLNQALRINPQAPMVHLLYARVLSEARQKQEAEKHFAQAVSLDPRARVAYGFWLQEEGRFSEAEACLRAAIELEPKQGQAYYGLLQAKKVGEEDRPLIEQMARIDREHKLNPRERSYLHYGLGKAMDAFGEYESAIRHFDIANERAHEVQLASQPLDKKKYSERIDRIIATFSEDHLRAKRSADTGPNQPIFIVGMIRSGTTLVEQIVSSHKDVSPGGELRFWLEESPKALNPNPPSPDRLAEAYREYLETIDRDKRVTDKMPLNYMWLGLIHLAFPSAPIIHIRRNPVDTCLSIYMTPYRVPPDFAYDRGNIVFAYREYERIMDHWRSVIPAAQLLEIEYEALVADREKVTSDMICFCGLEGDGSSLEHSDNRRAVNTPSLWQARQPIYKTSVERWRNYEPWLGAFAELRSANVHA